MDPIPIICCPRCGNVIGAAPSCGNCSLEVRHSADGVAYDYFALLKAAFPRRYRLYRVLCNNGFVSYHELAAGSLSLPERGDVAEFGAFLARHAASGGWVLDVGCGTLPVPGYLLPLRARGIRLAGLDIYPMSFEGFRIEGCAEFLPLAAGSMDTLVFATSLDHVCDLSATLREVARVLRPGGSCCIWMSDRLPYWRQYFLHGLTWRGMVRRFCLHLPRQMAMNLRNRRPVFYGIRHFFTHGRYWEYENGSTFYCPPGAVDPFHSFFESPAEIIALARPHGLVLTAREQGRNGVYLNLTRQ